MFGYDVCWIWFCVVVVGGVLVGFLGVYVLVVVMLLWVEGMIVGKGWIVFVLIMFVIWCLVWVLFGVYLFGGVIML